MTLKIYTQATFCAEIETVVKKNKCSYFDAVCDYVKVNNIEPEIVPRLLNETIRKKIEIEATDLNLINRGKKLKTIF